ncbi:hypothetical protein SacmaDRAFT_3258 [Saccharomonospora marina XMU15]|uniref:Actinobacteria/chloroflexi VLRF1 release factor domain-containing protein n=1 Tax=Saccharomonospora marina XMU15 TaxID=882083 RepID=H5X9P5_9PSEU|nr:acVLRF1 family peptidyl-tRNA hydrolase [Saccharomonospora marina]EHR51483.1 hypothetical protein SacmaDRAFT_3258 [Saccharomonospora marina XMU15]
MARIRQAPGGGRIVEVDADRLAGWFERFAERNGGVLRTRLARQEVTVTAGDGTTATVAVPFGPLRGVERDTVVDGLAVEALVEHVRRPRRVGLLLVRLGGHSVGVAQAGRVVRSRTDRHLVHGRSAAGGWSQQRFARRRSGQARQALRSAADDAVRVLAARVGELDAVVLGGDRRALDELRSDPRLAEVFALAEPRVLDVAQPRRSVLDEAARRAHAVEVLLR